MVLVQRTIAGFLCGFARVFTSTRVFGAERLLDGGTRVRVFVANHTSHADFLLLWAALPASIRETTRPVAAADYWEQGTVRRFLARRVFRAVLVSRAELDRHHNPLEEMLRVLRRGDSLILFPEGTRGDGSSLGEFRCGIFHLLQNAPDVDVVPVWLENVYRALPRRAFLPLPVPCAVAFGESYHRAVETTEKSTVLSELRAGVCEVGAQCKQWMRT